MGHSTRKVKNHYSITCPARHHMVQSSGVPEGCEVPEGTYGPSARKANGNVERNVFSHIVAFPFSLHSTSHGVFFNRGVPQMTMISIKDWAV